MGGYFLEYANFEEANNLKTPEHIAPVWYFTPFYSVLRAIPTSSDRLRWCSRHRWPFLSCCPGWTAARSSPGAIAAT